MKKVYFFGDGVAEGAGLGKEALGGKGSGLAEMTALGIPVPPGFTIDTSVCADFTRGQSLDGVRAEVDAALARVEQAARKRFGDEKDPLLVSVRSGARSSMPGMMDTILNLGLTSKTVPGLSALLGARFALDCRRRLHRDVLRRRPARAAAPLRGDPVGQEEGARRRFGHGADGGRPGRGRGGKRGGRPKGDRPGLSRRRAGAALGRDRRGVQVVEQPAGQDLPQDEPHSRRLGHGGQRAGDGVRQPRRDLRHGRGLHAQIPRPARRSSTASSCPTRRARTSWRASGRRRPVEADGSGVSLEETMPEAYAELRASCASGSRSTSATCRTWSSRSKTGSSTCCRRATENGRAPPPCASPAEMVDEGLITEDEALDPRRAGAARPAAGARLRPEREERRHEGERLLGKGLPAGPGAASGRIALDGAARRGDGRRGQAGRPGARRRPRPKTSRACTPRPGSSPRAAGRRPTPPWSPAGWGRPASSGRARSRWTTHDGKCGPGLKASEGEWLSIDGTTGEVIARAASDASVRSPAGAAREDASAGGIGGVPRRSIGS